jgi:flavin reductase (DIM6/NTAB) family NADH-FMN oxidoreductase RutF
MSISADLYREVFRRWPSGVAVLTSRDDTLVHGMVVSSFCSLASNPPLVMVSAGQGSRTHNLISTSGIYAISILSHDQQTIFERFAGFDPEHNADRFAGLHTQAAPATGLPIFTDAVAWVDCRVVAQHPGQGYTIFVGEILAANLGTAAETTPLLYYQRQTARLTPPGQDTVTATTTTSFVCVDDLPAYVADNSTYPRVHYE